MWDLLKLSEIIDFRFEFEISLQNAIKKEWFMKFKENERNLTLLKDKDIDSKLFPLWRFQQTKMIGYN